MFVVALHCLPWLPKTVRSYSFFGYTPNTKTKPSRNLVTCLKKERHNKNHNTTNNNYHSNCKELPNIDSKTLLSLGLDIHTKSIGFAIVSGWTGQAIRHGMIQLQHMEGADVFDKVDYVREQLVHLKVDTEQLYKEFVKEDIISWVVGVEAYLFRFLVGQSRAVSLFSLAEWNTLVSYECRWIFQRRPFKFHASKARSWLGLSTKKDATKDIKQLVFDYAYPFLLGFQTRYRPRSKAFCSTNFDISDAYVAARYAIRLEEERQLLLTSNISTREDKKLEKAIETQLCKLEKERIQASSCEVGQSLRQFIACHGNYSPYKHSKV